MKLKFLSEEHITMDQLVTITNDKWGPITMHVSCINHPITQGGVLHDSQIGNVAIKRDTPKLSGYLTIKTATTFLCQF